MSEDTFMLLIRMVDDYLSELGVSGLVDAKKARDQLLDLRITLASFAEQTEEPEEAECTTT